MDTLLCLLLRALMAVTALLPLRLVALIGQAGGAAAYWIDSRHRRVAAANLRLCFPGWSNAKVNRVARQHFRRLGEAYLCAIKTALLPDADLKKAVSIRGTEELQQPDSASNLSSHVLAIGHFGNFEALVRIGTFVPGYRLATTYRGFKQPKFDRLLRQIRARQGCLLFERRKDATLLREAMNGACIVGLMADQHAGDNGRLLPFFGHPCSVTLAPAIFALRYRCPLHVCLCHRTALGRWTIEISAPIPTRRNERMRAPEEIMGDVNLLLEAAVRRDPANWFWVHDRWKIYRRGRSHTQPAPAAPGGSA